MQEGKKRAQKKRLVMEGLICLRALGLRRSSYNFHVNSLRGPRVVEKPRLIHLTEDDGCDECD